MRTSVRTRNRLQFARRFRRQMPSETKASSEISVAHLHGLITRSVMTTFLERISVSEAAPTRLIEPRTLPGFRDYLPALMIPRERMMETARAVYRSYGFVPIDTPALEYTEILLGKGGDETDKQLFRFMHGDRDNALRFDLTVPLARFVAQHFHVLGTPFKRYHIATVWRGEKHQRGRYREFVQCDFDTIGTRNVASDAETILVVHDLLRAIGFERFTIHVISRLVLAGLLESLGLEK